jgi:hypothetical protein
MKRNPFFLQYDSNGDRMLNDVELKNAEAEIDIETKAIKFTQQTKMSWLAMSSMVIFTLILYLPVISVERVIALQNLIGMFYIAMAGVIAAYFGTNAYMTVNATSPYGGSGGVGSYGGYGMNSYGNNATPNYNMNSSESMQTPTELDNMPDPKKNYGNN